MATGPRYNVSLCGRVGRFAAGLASVPSSAWFVTRCTENAIWVFGLWPFKILIAKRGTGTQSGFGVDLVATQVWVRTQNFWVACRKCMKTHMIRNPNFGFGTQKWVWRRPCRKSGWVRTQNFWVACRKCMKTHMIRNPNFGFGTQKWVWRRPCRKSGRRPGLVKSRGRGRRWGREDSREEFCDTRSL